MAAHSIARRLVVAAPRALIARSHLSTAAADDSHNDFKPKTKVSPNDPDALKSQIVEASLAASSTRRVRGN